MSKLLRIRHFVIRFLAPACWVLAFNGAASADDFDLIIRGGTVLDGTGAARFVADVGVRAGHIARVGHLARDTAAREIDAHGLFVAPGFINIHDHPEPDAAFKAENVLTQGVTTEIGNADGSGTTDLEQQWGTMAQHGLATNLGLYIGFNATWAEVIGATDRRPDAADFTRMQDLIVRGLKHGAWGVSAGLDYKPAYFAREDEVIRVVSVAAPWRTNFPNHERLTPESGYSSLAGVSETVDIGARAGLVPVLTHMKAQGKEQQHSPEQLDLMEKGAREGRFVAGDIYPYTYGFNNVASLLIPAWALEGGYDALLMRFKDRDTRTRIVADIERVMWQRWNGPSGVHLVASDRELTDLMREWNVSAGEAIVRLNEQYGPRYETYLRFGIEDDVVRMLRHPNVAVACDCGSLLTVTGHPRAFGTFPLVLRRYVRETGVLTWEEAIRKMSGLPASIIGMTDRGLIAAGMRADITVFDPRTITDRGTAQSPQLSEGVRYVLVNGRLALSDGRLTGEQGGAVVKRAANMPSRAQNLSLDRRLMGTAILEGERAAQMTVKLFQGASQRAATGLITVKDTRGHRIFQSRAFGVLQTMPQWASVTGEGQLPNGETRVFVLTIDRGSSGLAPEVELRVDRAFSLSSDKADGIKLIRAP